MTPKEIAVANNQALDLLVMQLVSQTGGAAVRL
jgi:hypothetical protein